MRYEKSCSNFFNESSKYSFHGTTIYYKRGSIPDIRVKLPREDIIEYFPSTAFSTAIEEAGH